MSGLIVSGAGGQLGKAFASELSFRDGYQVYTFDRGQLDIADREKIHGILATLPKARYWVNCAAYTRVDDAESQPDLAFRYNAEAPGQLAEACREAGVHLIHFSSDYVYGGDLRRPLREDDPTAPQGVYAQSKLAGEEAIRMSGASHTLLRTSWVYGPGGHNFVLTMLRLAAQRDRVRVVGDQRGAPTFTHDIVWAVRELIAHAESGLTDQIKGTYNFANAGETTWDEFARTIFRYAGVSCQVETISTEAFGAPAPRPAYSVLDCGRIQPLLSQPIPHWEDALQRFLSAV